ncbi:MAG: hypothetical protein JWO67_6480 [Streptosporangiaceae bacterium]|nr:hypothetical protein [Streptosporangiaceae bacterium]
MAIATTLNTLYYPLDIPQGADWPGVDFPILGPNGQPYDLTGCSAKGQIRGYPDSADTLYTWSTSPAAGQGLITLNVPASTLTIRVLAVESVLWTFPKGVYDILLTNSSAPVGQQVSRVAMGPVTVSKEVTR